MKFGLWDEADLLGEVGGLSGKYSKIKRKRRAAIPHSARNEIYNLNGQLRHNFISFLKNFITFVET